MPGTQIMPISASPVYPGLRGLTQDTTLQASSQVLAMETVDFRPRGAGIGLTFSDCKHPNGWNRVVIGRIDPNTPTNNIADLVVGDVLLQICGHPVGSASEAMSLIDSIMRSHANLSRSFSASGVLDDPNVAAMGVNIQSPTIAVQAQTTAQVVVIIRENPEEPLGFSLVSDEVATGGTGRIVAVDVIPGGLANLSGLKNGDSVLAINDVSVKSLNMAQQMLFDLPEGDLGPVYLRVVQDSNIYYKVPRKMRGDQPNAVECPCDIC